MIRQASLFLLSLSVAGALSAETPRWTRATPFGSPMVALTQSSSGPQTLYSATAEGRVYASTNGGATWLLRPVPLETGEVIRDAVADPLNAQILYLRTSGSGLLRSRDGGASWTRIGAGLPAVADVAPDRSLSGVVWAATQSGLYRSDDRGGNWLLAAHDGLSLTTVAIDPHDPDTLLVAGLGHPLYSPVYMLHSTDHGANWSIGSQVPTQLGSSPGVPRFVFDAAHPGTTYVFFINGGFYAALVRTTDFGATWTPLPMVSGVNDIASSPDGTLFAATDLGLSKSTDQGATWEPSLQPAAPSLPNDRLVRILISATQPQPLLAAGSAGIWVSGDRGASWRDSSRGIVAQNALSILAPPSGPPALITAAGNSVYRSVNQGSTWTRLYTWRGAWLPRLAALHPLRPRSIYGIDSDGRSDPLLRSTNGGRSWYGISLYGCPSGPFCSATLQAVTFDPQHPETVYLAGFDPNAPGGNGYFLLRCNDEFRNNTLLESPPLVGLTADPDRSGTFYGRTCQGLYKSLDAGVSWRKIGRNLPPNVCLTALALDPRDTRKLWVGTAGKGLFFSGNGGATFQSMSRGLEAGRIGTLVFDPETPSRVYAGVSGQGVYHWNAASRRWSLLPNPGFPSAGYTGILTIDPQRPSILYASHLEQGIFRLELEE